MELITCKSENKEESKHMLETIKNISTTIVILYIMYTVFRVVLAFDGFDLELEFKKRVRNVLKKD